MKNPLTLAEIEPATFRFVAQHLNHCATAVAFVGTVTKIYSIIHLQSNFSYLYHQDEGERASAF